MRRVLVPVLLAFVLSMVIPPADADLGRIQPGDVAYTEAGQCTLGFVFDNGGTTYVSTAAHCVEQIGEDVGTSQFGIFGDVAWIGDADKTALDFAFIEVRAAFEDKIDPSLRGYPQWPTGYTTSSETTIGDRIQISGFGVGYSLTYPTQTKREGLHKSDTATTYQMNGLDTWGDSGGALVHQESGKAYGLVSRACIFEICTSTGPTVQGMVAYAGQQGFPVTLRTV